MRMANSVADITKYLSNLKVLSDLNPKDYITVEADKRGFAEIIASTVGKDEEMKFTQLRKFFGHIKKIEASDIKGKKENETIDATKVYLLLPELAYCYGRKLITKNFYDVFKICLTDNRIKTVGDFKRLVDFLAAVIAYCKEIERNKKGGNK